MGNLKEVIYLSNEDYSTLVTNGSVTIDGNTLVYDENSLYITPDQMQMSSTGDMIYSGDNNGTPTILPIGNVGQTLQVWADGLPHWADVSDDKGVTGVTAGAGLNTTSGDTATDGGTISTSGTLYLTKTAVSPGTYQGITVDKYGRVTGASNANYVTTTDSRLSDSRTPTAHASSGTTYGVGTTSNYGHVKTQTGDMSGTSSTNGIAAGLGHTHSNYQTAKPDGTNSLIDSSTSKVSTSYLPDFLLGQMVYGGTVARTGTAGSYSATVTLTENGRVKLGLPSGTTTCNLPATPTTAYEGLYFICTENDYSGTPIGSGYIVGDWVVCAGSIYKKVDNTDAVASVNGKTGTVTLTYSDVGALSSSTSIPENASDLINDRFVCYDINNQGLTDTQKANARTNIGAGTSNFTGYTTSNKLSTTCINNEAGWTSNVGSVTSVRVQATGGLTSSTSTAQSGTLDTTIGIDTNNYILPTIAEWNEKGTYSKPNGGIPASDLAEKYVRYDTNAQGLTDTQKGNARTNIGAGTSNFTGYTSSNKLSSDYINNTAGWASGTVTEVTGGTGLSVANGTTTPEVSVASTHKLPTTTEWSNGSIYSIVSGITTTAGNGNSGSYLSVKWTVSDVNGITTPYDGMKVVIRVPLAGVSTAGAVLSIDGGTTYHPLAYNVNSALTSHYPVNTNKVFVFNATQQMACYLTSNTKTTVTGVWQGESNYDSNTTITYGTLAYYHRPYVAATTYRYKFMVVDKDNRLVPFNTVNVLGVYAASTTYSANDICVYNGKIYKSLVSSNKGKTPSSSPAYWELHPGFTPPSTAFRPDKIYWYNTTTAINGGNAIGGNTLMSVGYNATNISICNFNQWDSSTTYVLPAYRMIYLCGTYDTITGLFTFRGAGVQGSKDYYTLVPNKDANITLSNYFVDGYDYILLGSTYSSNDYIHLREDHPMFHFNGTYLLPYDTHRTNTLINQIPGAYISSASVSGNTLTLTPKSGNATTYTPDVGVTSVATGTGLTGGTITSTGTISLADNYGDAKNPYASKTQNYVLAAPSNANGAPSFRALTAADIPALSYMTNPMTAQGDIIYGGANGTPSVLSSTSADFGKFLTLYADGAPHWATPDTGMSNPMTTAGDIIYGGASGAATRLAKGTARQVLKMNANATAPAWTSQGGTIFRGNAMSFYDGYYLLTSTPSGLGTGDFYLTTSGDPYGSTFSANDLFIIDSFNSEFDAYEATRIGHIGS